MTKDKFNLAMRLGLVALIALIVSPIIFMVVKGLVGIAAVLVIAGIMNALMPAAAEYLTQMKFGALKFVIDRAPVETLIGRAKERWDALDEQRQLLQQQAAQLEQYKKKAVAFSKQYPEEAVETEQNLKMYEELFAYRVQAFKDAKRETEAYMRTVDKAEAVYAMAVADAELGKSFGKNKDFMAIFREKTAFDAVDKASASALANLKMALVDNDYAQKVEAPAHAVTYDPHGRPVLGQILDMSTVPVPKLA